MKQSKFLFSLVLLFSLIAGVMQAQTFEKSKRLSRSFPVGSDTEVEMFNKYGNVHIVTWEKDSVRFDINLMVKGAKQAKVDKTFSLIDFDFESTKYYIITKTVFEGNSFWNDVTDIGSSFFGSNTKTKVDYTVYLPENIKLKLTNKYGSVYLADYSGKLFVNISNGDFKAHDLTGQTTIVSEFGNCDVGKVKHGNLTVSYGDFYLEEAGYLKIKGKSSSFHLSKVDELEMDSKRDKFFIDELAVLRGSAYFSRIELGIIDEVLDLSTKYGDLQIKSFGDKCDFFKLKTDDTDVTLHFTDSKQYKLSILANDETKIYYASTITNIKSQKIDDDKNLIRVDCVVGNNDKLTVPINIESVAGSLSLKRK